MKDFINPLTWDSSFFGYKVGMIEVEDPHDFNHEIFVEKAQDYKLIYIFSKQKIVHAPLRLVDEKITFEKIIDSKDIKEIKGGPAISGFDPTKHDLEELKDLALLSGIYSRFFTDHNFFNQEYKNLYLEWIDKSVKGDNAFNTLIYPFGNKIVGFVTVSQKNETTADIGLIAVNSNFRGKGIASGLIKAAIKSAGKNNFKKIQVVTQSANKPAVSLYKKIGFEEKSSINIYHYWNL